MDFTKNHIEYDENGVASEVPDTYTATLDNGIATISIVRETNVVPVCTQPWKTNSDGSRSEWIDLDEVVAWFKERD